MKITIHTPSAGVRAISIDGVHSHRFTIVNGDKLPQPIKGYALLDAVTCWCPNIIATSRSARELEFVLRNHLQSLANPV